MAKIVRARFSPDSDGDGTGELFVELSASPFAGASAAWFNAKDLMDFAAKLLATYPLSETEATKLEGGIWSESGKDIEQLLVGLSFYAVGPRGNVGCRVILATPSSPRWPEKRSRVEAELLTNYESVRSFAQGILSIVQDNGAEALLNES
jgi:hypothetical protein